MDALQNFSKGYEARVGARLQEQKAAVEKKEHSALLEAERLRAEKEDADKARKRQALLQSTEYNIRMMEEKKRAKDQERLDNIERRRRMEADAAVQKRLEREAAEEKRLRMIELKRNLDRCANPPLPFTPRPQSPSHPITSHPYPSPNTDTLIDNILLLCRPTLNYIRGIYSYILFLIDNILLLCRLTLNSIRGFYILIYIISWYANGIALRHSQVQQQRRGRGRQEMNALSGIELEMNKSLIKKLHEDPSLAVKVQERVHPAHQVLTSRSNTSHNIFG